MLGISRMNSVGLYINGEGKHRTILAIVCRLCDHVAKWPQRRRFRPRSLAAFQRARGPWPSGWQQTGPEAQAPTSLSPWPGAGLARNAAISAHGDQATRRPNGGRRPRQLLGGKSQLRAARPSNGPAAGLLALSKRRPSAHLKAPASQPGPAVNAACPGGFGF